MAMIAGAGTPARTPFIGRVAELGAFAGRLDAAGDAHGGFAVLRGEPGAGKTRLCEEIEAMAGARGFACLRGHCLDGEGSVPYLPFVELLESAAEVLGSDIARHAAGSSSEYLAIIAPQFGGTSADSAREPRIAEAERPALFSAVRDFLDRAARRSPLLLIIEDVHWAGPAAMLLLRHLVRFTASRRVLIVATCRPADAESEGARHLLLEIERQQSGNVVSLEELTAIEVASMIGVLAGREPPDAVAAAVYARAGGNPLFVEQVVRHLLDEQRLLDAHGRWLELTAFDEIPIPESARQAIEHRLARMTDADRSVLAVAAVAGQPATYELLRDVAALPEPAFLAAIEAGERAQLIVAAAAGAGVRIAFRHQLIRHAVLAQMSLPRRQATHLAIARAIERSADGATEAAIPELAHHYAQARSPEHAATTLHYLRAAAARALEATAFESAARLYAEALELVPADAATRCELLLLLGEAQKRVSDSDVARASFAEAAELARQRGDWAQYARAALGFARSWPTVGSVDATAVALLELALGQSPRDDAGLRARLMSRLALQRLYCGDPDSVLALARESVDAARQCGDAITLARALQVLHAALWQPQHLRERLVVATETIALAGPAGEPAVALWGLRPRIADLMELADVEGAAADIEAYDRRAATARQPIYLWQAMVRRAMLAIFRGHLEEGERLAQRALELGQQAEGQNLIAAFGGQLLVVRWLQGRVGELRPLIAASRQTEPGVMLWAAVLAFIEAEEGHTMAARALFEEIATDRFAAVPLEDSSLVVLVLASLVCAALGDGIRAEQLYELLLPYDGRDILVSEGVVCVGAAAGYLGLLAATARRWTDAERHFDDAIALNSGTGGRPWLAQAQYELARMLLARRETGDRARARELLRSSLGIARDAGMRALQTRIDAILRSHKRLANGAPGGLTRRELEVLRLIAQGRSTKEIARELVLSERTSARHITNIYAKIGVRNRVEASGWAMRHGIDSATSDGA